MPDKNDQRKEKFNLFCAKWPTFNCNCLALVKAGFSMLICSSGWGMFLQFLFLLKIIAIPNFYWKSCFADLIQLWVGITWGQIWDNPFLFQTRFIIMQMFSYTPCYRWYVFDSVIWIAVSQHHMSAFLNNWISNRSKSKRASPTMTILTKVLNSPPLSFP